MNYPAGWEKARINKTKIGVIDVAPRDFVGYNALSEMETSNMYKFSKNMKFDMTISLHSQGEEIYWGANKIYEKKAFEIGKKFERISKYKLTTPAYESSFAGYKDWYIKEFGKPSYTIELGRGEEGKSFDFLKVKDVYNSVEEIFLYALKSVKEIE